MNQRVRQLEQEVTKIHKWSKQFCDYCEPPVNPVTQTQPGTCPCTRTAAPPSPVTQDQPGTRPCPHAAAMVITQTQPEACPCTRTIATGQANVTDNMIKGVPRVVYLNHWGEITQPDSSWLGDVARDWVGNSLRRAVIWPDGSTDYLQSCPAWEENSFSDRMARLSSPAYWPGAQRAPMWTDNSTPAQMAHRSSPAYWPGGQGDKTPPHVDCQLTLCPDCLYVRPNTLAGGPGGQDPPGTPG